MLRPPPRSTLFPYTTLFRSNPVALADREGFEPRVWMWLCARRGSIVSRAARSEEHTSELQSRFDLVCRLLLEKKKTIKPVHATLSTNNLQEYCDIST